MSNESFLINSVRNYDIDEVKRILSKSKGFFNYHRKALLVAVDNDYNDIAKLIIDHGEASVHSLKDVIDSGILSNIALYMLEKYGDKIDHDSLSSTLLRASSLGKVNIIEQLLNHGASLDIGNVHDKKPLSFAASNGKFKAVQYLLEQGAKIGDKDKLGKTAMDHAVDNGYPKVAELIRSFAEEKQLSDEIKDGRNFSSLIF